MSEVASPLTTSKSLFVRGPSLLHSEPATVLSGSICQDSSLGSLEPEKLGNKIEVVKDAKHAILLMVKECMEIVNAEKFEISHEIMTTDVDGFTPEEYGKWIKEKAENVQLTFAAQKLKLLYEKHSTEHEEIIWYLDQEIKKKDETLQQLNSVQASMLENNRIIKEEREKEWQIEENKFIEELVALEKSYAELQAKNYLLGTLNEEMTMLKEKSAYYQTQIAEAKKEHFRVITEMEHANIEERERLKKELNEKIRENSKKFERMTEDQLRTTTITTIQMNRTYLEELALQSSKTEELLHEKNSLTRIKKSLKTELEVHLDTQQMLSDRTKELQKTILLCNNMLKNLSNEEKMLRFEIM